MTTNRTPTRKPTRTPVRLGLAATAAATALLVSACSGSSTTPASPAPAGSSASTGAAVIPVKSNPISNKATAKNLSISKVLVENNTDASGKAVSDHLQIELRNTGTATLSGFEVYYTIADAAAGKKESYYLKLPASFTIPAGGTKTANFDNTGAPGHFPVNKFSLYNTSKAALTVTVEVSATGAAPVTATAKKSPGGSENIGG